MKFINAIILYITLTSVALADNKLFEAQHKKNTTPDIVIEHNGEQFAMHLTGQTVRRKYFLEIYSMAHYIEYQSKASILSDSVLENKDNQIYQSVLQNNSVKQISMVFMRNLSAKQIQESLRSGIKLNCNENEFLQIRLQVETFMQAINADVNKNDEFTIQWFPDGSIISLFQGKQISLITDKKFAATLWAIWFGEYSVVDRKALIKDWLV